VEPTDEDLGWGLAKSQILSFSKILASY
jgi:hypothetical protein